MPNFPRKSVPSRQVLALAFLLLLGCGTENEVGGSRETESSGLAKKAKKGKQTLPDGSVYEGEMLGGKPNGYGLRKLTNGDVFDGQHKSGLAHGYGTMDYKSREEIERYSGLWKSGQREGYGTLVFSDSSRMEGHWEDDELLYGDYQGSDGVILSGKWVSSSLSEGRMKTALNEEFSGTFNPDGSFLKGTFLSGGGNRYTGSFKSNLYHGRGILEKTDGTLYAGDFEEGEYSGVGMLVEPDGSKYSGGFSQGIPEGFGIQEDVTGVTYAGNWSQGEKNGRGTLDFGDGTSFTGDFREGLAVQGSYDWGNGRITDSYQDENGEWRDR